MVILDDLRTKGGKTEVDIEALVNDEEFKAKIQTAENLDEVADLLISCGIEVTADDLKAALAQLKTGELDENTLDNVAGGKWSFGALIAVLMSLSGGPAMPRW